MRADESGFTLLETLVALAIVGIIVVGALGAVGAVNVSGLLEGFPTALIAGRTARDMTAAGVHLQAFQEFVARKAREAGTRNLPNTLEGTYCLGDLTGCDGSLEAPGSPGAPGGDLVGFPHPDAQSAAYQLDWKRLEVWIQRWYWDEDLDPPRYSDSAEPGDVTALGLIRVRSKLIWELKEQDRDLVVDRFIPILPEE